MKKITFFMIKIICLNNNESKFLREQKTRSTAAVGL